MYIYFVEKMGFRIGSVQFVLSFALYFYLYVLGKECGVFPVLRGGLVHGKVLDLHAVPNLATHPFTWPRERQEAQPEKREGERNKKKGLGKNGERLLT